MGKTKNQRKRKFKKQTLSCLKGKTVDKAISVALSSGPGYGKHIIIRYSVIY